MKKSRLVLAVFLSGLFLLSSCTIEQRLHRPGFHVEWFNKSKNSINKHEENDKLSAEHKNAETGTLGIVSIEDQLMKEEVVMVSTENLPALKLPSQNFRIPTESEVQNELDIPAHILLETKTVSRKDIRQYIREYKQGPSLATPPPAQNCKNWTVALLLGIFVGALGIHRFYLGYTTIGIIQLLTLGGCGIWALIDIIRIAIRDLQPANASYCD